jgi:heme/copper-type cytochrome/quinol oxidase subunit 2
VSLHNSYLAVLSALFALVFAIMIHSLARHRRACRNASFSGPGGSVQYLWAMVPVAILAGIDFALIEAPAELRAQAPAKIELAAAQPALLSVAAATASASDAEGLATSRSQAVQ